MKAATEKRVKVLEGQFKRPSDWPVIVFEWGLDSEAVREDKLARWRADRHSGPREC